MRKEFWRVSLCEDSLSEWNWLRLLRVSGFYYWRFCVVGILEIHLTNHHSSQERTKEKLLSPFLSCLFLALSHFNTSLIRFLPKPNVQNTSVPQPKLKPKDGLIAYSEGECRKKLASLETGVVVTNFRVG